MPAAILANDAKQALEYIRQGFRCVGYSGDVWLLQRALSEGVQAIHSVLAGGRPQDRGGTGSP